MATFSSGVLSRLLLPADVYADVYTDVHADVHAEAYAELPAAPTALEQQVLTLFAQLRTRLLRYAISFGLSVHDGEDIVQEVFLALFHHLQQGRPCHNLPGWTFRVTHNLALKRRQSNQLEGVRLDHDFTRADLAHDTAPGPEQQLLFQERQSRLRAVLQALPETDRCCLQLRAEELKYRDIAAVLGISLGSVAASLARSLARLERTEQLSQPVRREA